jgi:hypothetical protein
MPERISIQEVIDIVNEDIEAYSNGIMAAHYFTPAATTRLYRTLVEGRASSDDREDESNV